MSDDDEITVLEAANMLGVSDETVRRMVHKGELVGRRKTPSPHSHIVIKRASVEAYLQRVQIYPEE